jgi:phosphatidylglycerol:prolipoprotein diacylglycerol transferase
MWHYPEIDPVAIALGPVQVHWYALSYLVGIGLVWLLLRYRIRRDRLTWTADDLADLVFYAVLGVILGGRIGYMLFYGMENLVADPLSALKVWQGGMSFHGGLLGVLAGIYFFGRRRGRRFFEITDFIAPAIPLALGSGRIGNFINAELPGRVSDLPWAVIYPGDIVARHPSSLYQAILEGPVLFMILWLFAMRTRPEMSVSGLFLLGYGSLRMISETFREPDSHIGYLLFEGVTAGQLLSLPMALIGTGMLIYSYRIDKK